MMNQSNTALNLSVLVTSTEQNETPIWSVHVACQIENLPQGLGDDSQAKTYVYPRDETCFRGDAAKKAVADYFKSNQTLFQHDE